MRKDIQGYYRALNLSPGATAVEIRRAYHQLIRRWHPDFFKPGSLMQTTAEDLSKEINEAFEQLYKKKLYRKFLRTAEPAFHSTPEPASRPPSPKPKRSPAKNRVWRSRRWPWRTISIFACLIAIGAAIQQRPSKLFSRPPTAATVASRPRPMANSAAPPVSAPPSTAEKIHARSEAPQVQSGASLIAVAAEAHPPSPAFDRPLPDNRFSRDSLPTAFNSTTLDKIVDEAELRLETFEVGDSKARVLSIQGTPDDAQESVFRYGSSLVYFENGRVRDWSDRQPRLRIRVWPALGFVSLDTFAVGAARSEVIRAQGLPTAVNRLGYSYGSSFIYFGNDRVTDWIEGDTPLRNFTLPTLPFIDLDSLSHRYPPSDPRNFR